MRAPERRSKEPRPVYPPEEGDGQKFIQALQMCVGLRSFLSCSGTLTEIVYGNRMCHRKWPAGRV